MKQKIRTHFLKFGPQRFVLVTVSLLLLTDLLNSWYLKLYWVKKDYAQVLIKSSIRRGGMMVEEFHPDTMAEMLGFLNNTFNFFLLIILANNIFFYFFYLRKRLWAQGFVLFYTLTAGLFSLTLLFDNSGLGSGWFIYNFLTIFMYIYLYLGVKVLRPETTVEKFTPSRGKKGR